MRDDVGVVFVSYHSEALIAPLAETYRAAGALVRIVDNSGTYPTGVDILSPGRNVGFGRACNLGVAALPATVRRVCLHNPDVGASLEALDRAVSVLDERPSAGAVAPREVTRDGVRCAGYAYPSPLRELFLGLRVRYRSGTEVGVEADPALGAVRVDMAAALETASRPASRPRRFPAFCFVVVDRDAFDAIGGFDDGYFLYAEDLDLWHRLTRSGRAGLIDPASAVFHDVGTATPASRATREMLRWSGVELFAQRFDRLGWRPYRAAHRLALRVYPRSPLRERLEAMWRRRWTPEEVAGAVRSDVESGAISLSD